MRLTSSAVFPLLFFKRISDVNDEEHAAALKEFDGDEVAALFSENYGFQIPAYCHWADVRKVATNVGQACKLRCAASSRPIRTRFTASLATAQWTNKDRLSDALLLDLIEHFSKLSLGNSAAKAMCSGSRMNT